MNSSEPSLRVHVTYYASLREQRGVEQESLAIASSDLRQLYRELARAHAFALSEAQVRPAVNDAFCDWDRPLTDGDRVVFVPPVAGG